jgi:hypothetical protein
MFPLIIKWTKSVSHAPGLPLVSKFYVIHVVHFFTFNIFTNKMHYVKYNKTQITVSAHSYMYFVSRGYNPWCTSAGWDAIELYIAADVCIPHNPNNIKTYKFTNLTQKRLSIVRCCYYSNLHLYCQLMSSRILTV